MTGKPSSFNGLIIEVVPTVNFQVRLSHRRRQVILTQAPADLEQIGITAGTVVSAIAEQPAYDYAAKNGKNTLSHRPRPWDFIIGERTIRIGLKKAAAENAAEEDDAEAPASDDSGPPRAEVIRVRFTTSVGDEVFVDIDKSARTVVLGEVSANLAAAGVVVGAVCSAINGMAPYEFLKGGLPNDKILQWDFAVGEKTDRLGLIFTETSENASPGARVSDAVNCQPANSFYKGGIIEGPGFVTGIPFSDHSYHERPSRKVAVEYVGSWGQNMGPDVDPASRNDGRSFTPPKQRAPIYDR